MVSQPNLSKAIIKTKIFNVTFEKYSTKTGGANTISDHSCQNSNKIHLMAGTSKYKLFRKSPTSSFLLKFHFGEKNTVLFFLNLNNAVTVAKTPFCLHIKCI